MTAEWWAAWAIGGVILLLIALVYPASACEIAWCPPPTQAAAPPQATAPAQPRRERYRPRRHFPRQVASIITPRAVSDALRRYRYLTAAASIALAGEALRSPTVTAAELVAVAMVPLPAPIDLRDPADFNEIDMLAVYIADAGDLNAIDMSAPPPKPRILSALLAGIIAFAFFIALALIIRSQIAGPRR